MIAPSDRTSPNPPPHPAEKTYTRDAYGLWADIPAFTTFAEEVASSMLGGEVLLAKREELIKRASHLGIRRFDAHLIIAMVQHRAGTATVELDYESEPKRTSLWSSVAVVATVQLLIFAGVWWILK